MGWLESRDETALQNGANLAAVGSELIQFASAIPIGPGRFRLGALLRGCRGTEWAMVSHAADEPFVLIVPGALQEVVLPPFALGTAVAVTARGLADDGAQPVSRIVGGEAMKPPSPIDLIGQLEAGGGLALSWTRRSRLGWLWPAGSEMPLGESSERYRVTLNGSAGTLTFETFQPQIIIAAEDLAGMTGPVMVSVVQVGDFAESRPATTSFVI